MSTKLPLLRALARSCCTLLAGCLLIAAPGVWAAVDSAPLDPAAALRARYVGMQDTLRDSPFGRPLHLESREYRARLEGDVYAVSGHPFPTIVAAITDAASWCEVLSLQLNVKRCSTAAGAPVSRLTADIGRMRDDTGNMLQRLELMHRTDAETPDYIRIVLDAGAGPLGTRDPRIVLEAVAVGPESTFLHLSYSYGYGPVAALALRAYLGTAGASKVGFTVIGRRLDGKPMLVGGLRGALERNSMRYFLALEACLGARATAMSAELHQRRLLDWFAATELYPQLHEVSLSEYLQMKQPEPASLSAAR